ncbi:unnamed protein product [Nippostrongylus brasiliensis]|uniref:Neuropeptide-like 1 n=1 Tax=Nippostrongylus brasiliensis TaxID=27835 RepID=A0A0N4Y6P4_NIPBR|nr:unnamed protein product [Nippostrongylus brasiliensis]
MQAVLLVALLLISRTDAILDPTQLIPAQLNPLQAMGQYNCAQCMNNYYGAAAATEATTSAPAEETTQNAFQRAGWETDDKGNVFVGNDDAKLLLISVGSYWPFPKDYRRKKREITTGLLDIFR